MMWVYGRRLLEGLFALGVAMLVALAVMFWPGVSDRQNRRILALPPAPAYTDHTDEFGRILLARVGADRDDFVAQNLLASHLLQRARETGDFNFLERAKQAAEQSLHSVPAERNSGGLGNLARAELAEHRFPEAREHAVRLTRLDGGTLGSWAVLTDTLLELGDYAGADEAVERMRQVGHGSAETEIRLARLRFLQGDSAAAEKHLFRATAIAQSEAQVPRETVAWCRWQSGELAFLKGEYPEAEGNYRSALQTFPGYPQALASLGRVRAARGDLSGAIAQYEAATRRLPDPTFLAALGDLYTKAGRVSDAQTQYELVEHIGRLNALNGARYNRQLALYRADHDRNLEAAYQDARREYQVRRDLYGADALAWTASKAGHHAEAQQAITRALRLHTGDPRLLFHAGMIARAAGDNKRSRQYLREALRMSPVFDPVQVLVAQAALNN